MKKLYMYIMVLFFISNSVCAECIDISQKDLIEIYKIAIESLLPKSELLEDKSYFSIDMNDSYFENIALEGKEEILKYFKNKYTVETINASYDKLQELGLMKERFNHLKSNGKKGVFLKIEKVEFQKNNKVIINGFWYTSEVSAIFHKSVIVFKDGKWILQEKKMTGFS